MIYCTSDWHFNHDKPFIYEPRGFPSVEEMNEAIIERHNSIVKQGDVVYCLGDCCLGGGGEDILNENKKLIERLNGQIHIIRGNHCTNKRINMYKTCSNVIECEQYVAILKYRKYNFYLSHYPTITSNGEFKSLHQVTCNLFGHTHSKALFYEDVPYIYNVALDAHNCFPVSLDTIIDNMKDFMNKTNCTLITK